MTDMEETRVEAKLEDLTKAFNDFKLQVSVDIAKMQLKQTMQSSMYGLIGGVIPAGIVIIGLWLKSYWKS